MRFLCIITLTVVLAVSCRTSKSSLSDDTSPGGRANSGTRKITEVRCADATGDRELKIKRSENELPFPTYHVEFIFRGTRVSQVTDAPVAINNGTRFVVKKVTNLDDREDIEVSAGVTWTEGRISGYYREAANGGLSPLPGVDFAACAVVEVGAIAPQNVPRNIAKIECVDNSGDRKLSIKRSNNELPFAAYHVEFIFRSQLYVRVTDAPVAVNNGARFIVQKVTDIEDRENIQVSAGVDWSSGQPKGFYQEAANNGTSPLPGTQFDLCSITEGR